MPNTLIRVDRMKGDRRTPITGRLTQGGAVVNLTGMSVVFHMVKQDGTVKVNSQAASIVSAAAGTVSYAPTANDVDTAGEYFGWFIITESGKTDHFPHDGNKYQIVINEIPQPS
jgi:hypothetical protein